MQKQRRRRKRAERSAGPGEKRQNVGYGVFGASHGYRSENSAAGPRGNLTLQQARVIISCSRRPATPTGLFWLWRGRGEHQAAGLGSLTGILSTKLEQWRWWTADEDTSKLANKHRSKKAPSSRLLRQPAIFKTTCKSRLNAVVSRWLSQIGTFYFCLLNFSMLQQDSQLSMKLKGSLWQKRL